MNPLTVLCLTLALVGSISSYSITNTQDWPGTIGSQGAYANSQYGLAICEKDNIFYGIQPHPYNCNQYVLCSQGITHELDCARRDVRAACRITEQYCQNNAYAPYGNPDDLRICESQSVWDGVYPHPYECDKYILCYQGVTQEVVCPSHDARTACDVKDSQTYCNVHLDQDRTKDYHGRDATYCKDRRLTTGVHPDPQSCYGYIVCTYDRTSFIPCPAGTAFSSQRVACINENFVDCTNYFLSQDEKEDSKEAVVASSKAADVSEEEQVIKESQSEEVKETKEE